MFAVAANFISFATLPPSFSHSALAAPFNDHFPGTIQCIIDSADAGSVLVLKAHKWCQRRPCRSYRAEFKFRSESQNKIWHILSSFSLQRVKVYVVISTRDFFHHFPINSNTGSAPQLARKWCQTASQLAHKWCQTESSP